MGRTPSSRAHGDGARKLLTCGFLRCARRVPNPHRHPRLCDWVNPATSRVWTVLLYWSMLATGRGRRLCLLTGGMGSIADWLSLPTSRAVAVIFTRALFCASSWAYRRHAVLFGSYPWLLASLPDERVPWQTRFAIAERAASARSCCLDDEFTGRILKHNIYHAQDLLTDNWLRFITAWAASVRVSIAAVEFAHAANRAAAKPSMNWSSFSALYLNREFVKQTQRSGGQTVMQTRVAAKRLPTLKASDPHSLLRAPSAFLLFRKEMIARDCQHDTNTGTNRHNPASKRHWAQARDDWNKLSEMHRASYFTRAEQLRDTAAHNRTVRARAAAGLVSTTAATGSSSTAASSTSSATSCRSVTDIVQSCSYGDVVPGADAAAAEPFSVASVIIVGA